MSSRRGLEAFYGERGYARDLALTTAGLDTAGEAEFILMLSKFSPAPMVDLGVGFGRHMERLRGADTDVVGVDIVLDCCRKSAVFGSVVCASTSALPFRTASFGVAYSYFTSIGFTEPDPSRFLSECARVLVPQGLLVLEIARPEPSPRFRVWRENIDPARAALGVAIRRRSRRGVHVWTWLVSRIGIKVRFHSLSYTLFGRTMLEAVARGSGLVRRRDLELKAPASTRELLVLQAVHV